MIFILTKYASKGPKREQRPVPHGKGSADRAAVIDIYYNNNATTIKKGTPAL